MSNEVIKVNDVGLAISEDVAARMEEIADHRYAENTRDAYERDVKAWQCWLATRNAEPSEAQLYIYLTWLAKDVSEDERPTHPTAYSLATIRRKYAVIAPEVVVNHSTFKGFFHALTNTYAEEQKFAKEAKPMSKTHLQAIVDALPGTPAGVRNRALLLLAYYGGFRSSEVVSLTRSDLTETADGLIVRVRNSKTAKTADEKAGKGMSKGIVYKAELCPVKALRAWLAMLPDGDEQRLFVSVDRWGVIHPDRPINRQDYARLLNKLAPDYSTHSMRAGFVTDASIAGANLQSIMKQTGHKTPSIVMRYIREVNVFQDNAVNLL